jgi:hypothetical protein
MSGKVLKKKPKRKRRPRSEASVAAHAAASRWNQPTPSRSPGAPAANDSGTVAFAKIRAALNLLSQKAGEYCGLPPMIEGEQLIVEPTHRAYKVFQDHNAKTLEAEGDDVGKCVIVNEWWSRRHRTQVILWRGPDGKLAWGRVPAANHLRSDIRTMGCSIAWSAAAECKAMEKLGDLIPDHLFRGYFLTGMFLETSKRSGVTYLFRRLKPTVALRPGRDGDMRIIACLCMHPIGHYADSWAGALCPTDDVICHLLLMRSDEAFFWKKANQIPAYRPEAGL